MIFTSSLLDISNKSIPKTTTNPKKSKPWYNDECKDAIKQRKQALSKFRRYPTKENLNNVVRYLQTLRISERRLVPASVAQLDARPTGDQVAGSTPPPRGVGNILSWRLPLGIKLSALPRPWGLNSHWERC